MPQEPAARPSDTVTDTDTATDAATDTAAHGDPRERTVVAPAQKGLIPRVIAWLLQLRIVRAFLHYTEHRGPLLADSVTYRTLFSVFAGVLLGFSVAGIWLSGSPDAMAALMDAVDAAIPGLMNVIDPSDIQLDVGLSIAGVVSAVGLIGAAIGAVGSLRAALRILADTLTDDTLFIWVILRNLALAIGLGVALALSAVISFLGSAFLGALGEFFGIASDSPLLVWGARILTILVTFTLDVAVVAAAFRMLSGTRPSAKALWSGAVLGGIGLTVLQQLSGLFVGGASSNPLLATFASLIALLLWFNLSSQVILIASAYIVTSMSDEVDRVSAKFGATTFAERRVKTAERAVMVATDELNAARQVADEERAKTAEQAAKKAAEKSAEADADQRA